MAELDKIVAFIPAAGLGTRLKPLTDNKPKALVHFMGKTMLENVLERIFAVGIRKFIVNIHHFPELMKQEIKKLKKKYDIDISDESEKLLDTGGGLVKAAKIVNEEFTSILVHNVDVYAEIDYGAFINDHFEKDAQITMVVSQRSTNRKLLFKEGVLNGWKNFKTNEFIGLQDSNEINYKAFSGIHLADTKLLLSNAPDNNRFPLIPWYIELCQRYKVYGWEHSPKNWCDLGTVERIEIAGAILKNSKKNG